MKPTGFVTAVILIASLGLGGCVIKVDGDGLSSHHSDHDRQEHNRDRIADLNLGASLGSVKTTFGTADFVESYPKGDDRVEVLFYRTHKTKSDGLTTKDECTPLVFVNGALVGWGQTALDKVLAG